MQAFEADVLSCQPFGEHFAVVLNQTAFYPEGGGQPADTGVLGDTHVLDVREKNGEILHITQGPLQAGAHVHGQIDWDRRFLLMQHHSGEHIISGVVHRLYKLDNVGFHMGKDAVTIDFNGELQPEDVQKVEDVVNKAIYQNVPVTASFPDAQTLAALDYRSKKELSGDIRIVEVQGYDLCACCGTHTKTTGEVGIVKFLSCQRYKGGVRLSLLCGRRALEDYRAKMASTNAISVMLSTKESAIVGAVEHLKDEISQLKMQLGAAQNELYALKAENIPPCAGNLALFEEGLSPDGLRRFCLKACSKAAGVTGVFSGSEESGYQYAVASQGADVRAFGKEMNQALNGRGGGSKELIQGSVKAKKAQIEAFFAK